MARGITKKEKLEQFDGVKSERDKLQLALFDVLNNGFLPGNVRLDLSEYGGSDDKFTMRMSPRGNPLFLVRFVGGHNFEVWTETEIEEMYRRESPYHRMLQSGRDRLMHQWREMGSPDYRTFTRAA